MKYVKHYTCTECGTTYPIETPMNLCPRDQRPVRMTLDTEAIAADYPNNSWYHPEQRSMWRFGHLLPFDISSDPESVCSLGEGHTPVLPINDYQAIDVNANCYIKDEGQPYPGYGANPTGSFKDRGMSMVTTMAKHYGLNKLTVPTQGNAGDSLSEYATAFGMAVALLMPDDTPMPILGKVAAYSHIHSGVSLDLVKGTIREAGALMKQKYVPKGYFNCATFQEPGWRIEGKKTMGLELAEPWPNIKPQWSLPDVILYPTGGGTGILGMWKAFDELEAVGAIGSKRPKILSIQSAANAPVVDAFAQDLADTVPTDGGDTLATGLNVPGGVGQKAVLKVLRDSQGGAIKVSEQAMAKHVTGIYQQYGMWISPEGAAAVAALPEAQAQGLIQPEDLVVCFNTGSAEKYLPDMRHLFFMPE